MLLWSEACESSHGLPPRSAAAATCRRRAVPSPGRGRGEGSKNNQTTIRSFLPPHAAAFLLAHRAVMKLPGDAA